MNPYGSWSPTPMSNIEFVDSYQEVQTYPMNGPGMTRLLMDRNNPVFYLKTTDMSGFTNIKICDFTVREPIPEVTNPAISVEDMKRLIREVLNESTVSNAPADQPE